jgi:hypothetical protein
VATNEQSSRPVWGLRVIIAVVVLAVLAGFVWLWWIGLPLLMDGVPNVQPSERLTAVTGTRTALLAGLIGIGAIGTFLVNILTSRVTAQTFKLTQRGYLTDRYSKAIEQLGSETLDVRLGGIYALEQLATDSDQASTAAAPCDV